MGWFAARAIKHSADDSGGSGPEEDR